MFFIIFNFINIYYIMKVEAYILDGCYFSEKALYSLTKNIKEENLKIINVPDDVKIKNKYKKKNKMSTFPQIFIKVNKKKIKIGGSDDLMNMYRIINEIKTYTFSLESLCLFNDLLN